jgi:undecaprenyl-diphosphatase
MSWFSSCILGIIQALTEFLPVSSSAHLKIAEHLLKQESNLFTHLSCHLGTLLALTIFLRKEIFELLFIHPKRCFTFFIALLPLIPFYFLLKPLREVISKPEYLGLCLMGTGLILGLGQLVASRRAQNKQPSIKDIVVIGTLQAVALIPGISRSASTISGARMLGWQAKDAVRFSFLLSIPTVLGGNLLEFTKAIHHPTEMPISFLSLIIGFLTSFIIGLFLVKKAISWLERGNLLPCACYCLLLGALVTFYFNR